MGSWAKGDRSEIESVTVKQWRRRMIICSSCCWLVTQGSVRRASSSGSPRMLSIRPSSRPLVSTPFPHLLFSINILLVCFYSFNLIYRFRSSFRLVVHIFWMNISVRITHQVSVYDWKTWIVRRMFFLNNVSYFKKCKYSHIFGFFLKI